MKNRPFSLPVVALCLAGLPGSAGAESNDLPYLTQFEEGFQLGSLAGQDGWHAEGAAEVRDSLTPTSARAVLLAQGGEGSRVWRTFTLPAELRAEPVYFDFFLQPVAGKKADEWTTVEAGSSAILFAGDPAEEEGSARVFLLDETDAAPQWIPADFRFPFLAGRPDSDRFLRVTLRQAGGVSDVFIDGRHVGTSQTEAVDEAVGSIVFAVQGARLNDVQLADLYIGTISPLPPEAESFSPAAGRASTAAEAPDAPDASEAVANLPTAVGSEDALEDEEPLISLSDLGNGEVALQVFTPLE